MSMMIYNAAMLVMPVITLSHLIRSRLALQLHDLVHNRVDCVAYPSNLFVPLCQVAPFSLKVDHIIDLQQALPLKFKVFCRLIAV